MGKMNAMMPLSFSVCGLRYTADPPLSEGTIILGSRFYIKVFPPASSRDRSPIRHRLAHSGLTKDRVRLELCPSTHYGVNGSYRVEYWESRPFYPTRPGLNSKDKLVREEYWHIPNRHLCTKRVEMLRSDVCTFKDDTDPIPDSESLNIVRVKSLRGLEGTEWLFYTLEDIPYPGSLSVGSVQPVWKIGISWGTIKPRTATRYTLEYEEPLGLCDILYDR